MPSNPPVPRLCRTACRRHHERAVAQPGKRAVDLPTVSLLVAADYYCGLGKDTATHPADFPSGFLQERIERPSKGVRLRPDTIFLIRPPRAMIVIGTLSRIVGGARGREREGMARSSAPTYESQRLHILISYASED